MLQSGGLRKIGAAMNIYHETLCVDDCDAITPFVERRLQFVQFNDNKQTNNACQWVGNTSDLGAPDARW